MTNLIVCDVTIKQDAEGRYCLNDLHKAAGGEDRHQPAHFWEAAGDKLLQVLILENPRVSPKVAKAGRYGGTFVVKELVYAYAMWISPKFHLEVIRSYDRLATEGVAVHTSAAEAVLDDPLSYMEKIIAQAKQLKAERDRLASENQELTHERDGLSSVVGSKMHTLGRFARTLPQINSLAIKSDLQRLGYLYRKGGTYRIYRQYEHLFVEKFNDQYGSIDIFVTEKGKTLIASLADQKKLTMKKAYAA